MAPTYIVGARDRYPTAIAAPSECKTRWPRDFVDAAGPERPSCAKFVFLCLKFIGGGAVLGEPPMNLDKADLRAQALARRAEMARGDAADFAGRLADKGLDLARQLRPNVASAFFPLPNEPPVLPLLDALAKAGFKTALPVTGRRGTPLIFRLWRPGEPTAKGKMAIEEPLADSPEAAPDLLFVPLAAFDRAGRRIGYGAGFYDRTLRQLRAMKQICAVGVAYAAQEFPELPNEPHDERLDYVLTERELIGCRARSHAHSLRR
jgi:5-formyltetrahydrofolate cyclo-ligase